jgi:hypothetical protein
MRTSGSRHEGIPNPARSHSPVRGIGARGPDCTISMPAGKRPVDAAPGHSGADTTALSKVPPLPVRRADGCTATCFKRKRSDDEVGRGSLSDGSSARARSPRLPDRAEGAGRAHTRMNLTAPYFDSPWPASKRDREFSSGALTGRQSLSKAAYQMLFIHRLTKITNDPVGQRAGAVSVVGISSDEDCGNGSPHLDEVPIKLDPGHRRHINVSDQAGRFTETSGGKEIGRRWKNLDGMAQRPQEPSHGLAKEPIIFNDRNQQLFHHAAFGSSLEPAAQAAQQCRRSAWDYLTCAKNATGAMPVRRKLWLISKRGLRRLGPKGSHRAVPVRINSCLRRAFPPKANGAVQVQRLGLELHAGSTLRTETKAHFRDPSIRAADV